MSRPDQIHIHYWSSTGNTALAAKEAAKAIASTGAEVFITDIENNHCETIGYPVKETNDENTNTVPPEISSDALFIFAAPVHGFGLALKAKEYLEKLKLPSGTRVVGLFTCAGFADRTPTQFAGIVRKKGAIPFDYTVLICEDSWPVARNYMSFICSWDEPSKERLEALRAFFRAIPGRIQDNDNSKSFWTIPTPLTPVRWIFRPSLLERTFPLYVDNEKCTKCGACERQCPVQRIHVGESVEYSGTCYGCYGCINICPVDAIDTWLTKGAPRYRGPAQDE